MYLAKISDLNRTLVYSVAVLCLAVAALLYGAEFNTTDASTANAANTKQTSLAPATTFPADAPSLGAIPDGTAGAGVCGADRNVTFTAAGISAPLTNVEVSVLFSGTGPGHTWIGDVEASLLAPGGAPTHLLFSRTGATTAGSFGDSSNALGAYNFKDSAAGIHFWTAAANEATGTAPVAAGDYRTVAAGPSVSPPALTTMTTTFAGLTTGQIAGIWTLRMRDCGGGDTGTVSAASLTLTGGAAAPAQHIVDFDGNGKTDFAIVRNTGGGPTGQATWMIKSDSGAVSGFAWGLATDFFVPEDYDGDNKTDIAVWRPGAPAASHWYILNSIGFTLSDFIFGQTGDDPTVQGDYDGDGKADIAVYRSGAASGDQSTWFYRGTLSNPGGNITFVPWGSFGDFPAPGDYDGDGKGDFVIQRDNGGGQARFFMLQTTAGFTSVVFGTPTDIIVPGDYDGDGKTDIATVRGSGGNVHWFVRPSSTGVISGGPTAIFGDSATDFMTQGDYDGDGKTDFAIWRPNADPTLNFFYILGSTSGFSQSEWGMNGDYPVANYNEH